MPPETNADTTSAGDWVLIDRRTIDTEQQRIAMIRHYAEALLSVLPGHPLEPDQLRDSLLGGGGQPAGRQDDVELVDLRRVDPSPTDQRTD